MTTLYCINCSSCVCCCRRTPTEFSMRFLPEKVQAATTYDRASAREAEAIRAAPGTLTEVKAWATPPAPERRRGCLPNREVAAANTIQAEPQCASLLIGIGATPAVLGPAARLVYTDGRGNLRGAQASLGCHAARRIGLTSRRPPQTNQAYARAPRRLTCPSDGTRASRTSWAKEAGFGGTGSHKHTLNPSLPT